jgi:hypothetical protein
VEVAVEHLVDRDELRPDPVDRDFVRRNPAVLREGPGTLGREDRKATVVSTGLRTTRARSASVSVLTGQRRWLITCSRAKRMTTSAAATNVTSAMRNCGGRGAWGTGS